MANTHRAQLVGASSQYFSAADSSSLDITGNMTVELWAKLSTQPGTNESFDLVSKHNETGNQRGYLFRYQDAAGVKKFEARISTDGTSGANQSTTTLNYSLATGVWYRIAFVYTAASGTIDIYIDGVSAGQMTSVKTSIFANTAEFRIGRSQDGNAYYNGFIDDVRIWNTTKSAGDILTSMRTELVGNESNLQAYWKLNNALTDSTANANTLTNNGVATFSASDLPFGDAIAVYDTTSGQYFGSAATSHTLSHTMSSNANRILTVFTYTFDSGTTTGVTYNGVAMTESGTGQATGSDTVQAWSLVAPSTGANNIVASLSASKRCIIYAVSFTNVTQSGQPDATNKGAPNASTVDGTITSVANNCIAIMAYYPNGSGDITGIHTNWKPTLSIASRGAVGYGYNITPAGGYTQTINLASSGTSGFKQLTISPLAGTNYSITADVGAFVLTGQSANLRLVATVPAALGTYTLSGQDVTLKRGFGIVAGVGSYTLTGNDVVFLNSGWTNATRNVSSYTNRTRNTSTYSNNTKSSSTWTNRTRH